MPDTAPATRVDAPLRPPAVPEPTWLQKQFTALLPQFVAYSRKGLIWFNFLSASALLEFVKSAGSYQGWTDVQVNQWHWRVLFFQALMGVVAKWWTDQIKEEDKALKTGLPPPPVIVAPVQGLPPAPPRGEGD